MTTNRGVRLRALAVLAAAATLVAPQALRAQEHEHEHEHGEQHEHGEDQHEHEEEGHHHGALHFSHPLVAESVTPDTKFRLDAHYSDGDGGSTLEMEFEAEYAFAPAFSIEVGASPYTHADPAAAKVFPVARTAPPIRAHLAPGEAGTAEDAFSDFDVALKFANFAFAEHGVLLGYGATLGFPLRTGDEPVHAITSVEPFLNVGYQKAGWELEGFARFAIPTAGEAGGPGNADLGTNVSVLRHLGDQVQALFEMDSASPLGGGDDPTLVHLTPGLKVRPIASNEHLIIGAGLRFPVSSAKTFGEQAIVSVFWHF